MTLICSYLSCKLDCFICICICADTAHISELLISSDEVKSVRKNLCNFTLKVHHNAWRVLSSDIMLFCANTMVAICEKCTEINLLYHYGVQIMRCMLFTTPQCLELVTMLISCMRPCDVKTRTHDCGRSSQFPTRCNKATCEVAASTGGASLEIVPISHSHGFLL